MPLFAYTGQSSVTGKKAKGSIEADSIKDARLRLKKQNIYVLTIKEDTASATASGGAGIMARLKRKPPKPEDLSMATKQFAVLTKAAVDVSEALKAISEQVENEELASVYFKLRELVSEGKSISDAHRTFPKVFSPLYTNMIAAAERAGALPVVLKRLSDFITYQITVKRKVIGALTYPAIMVVMSMSITIFLFVNVLPKISKAFSSMKVTLPWYSIMMNNISSFLQAYWLPGIIFIGISIVALMYWIRTPKGKYKFDGFILKLPIFGPVLEKVAVSRFAKTLATVFGSGVRIVEALQLTKSVVGNAVLEEAIDNAINKVQDGDKLSVALQQTKRFPPMVVHMLRTGEKTGKLEEMLFNIAENYDEEVDHSIASSTRLIEPVMMIFIAGVVVMIVMSVMGPLMQAMNSLK